jgi:hypothetical protein
MEGNGTMPGNVPFPYFPPLPTSKLGKKNTSKQVIYLAFKKVKYIGYFPSYRMSKKKTHTSMQNLP